MAQLNVLLLVEMGCSEGHKNAMMGITFKGMGVHQHVKFNKISNALHWLIQRNAATLKV